jgi:hypothetical protein
MMTQAGIRHRLLAARYALGVIAALTIAIGVAPSGADAVRIALAAHRVTLGRALRGGAPDDPHAKCHAGESHRHRVRLRRQVVIGLA